jgi:orotidine-5'-phosphate decarboxylase
MFKVGGQLFTSSGPAAVERLARLGPGVFLDLKFHDIPNTVAGMTAAACRLRGVRLLTLHASGGSEMMRAARAVRHTRRWGGKEWPKLLAVTLLTSLDRSGLHEVGISGPFSVRVVKLAKLAQKAGMDGVVVSPREVRAVREACGGRFLIVVPAVRPTGAGHQDQARTGTPAEAIRVGADFIVVGRPITAASDPVAVTRAILREIAAALPHV